MTPDKAIETAKAILRSGRLHHWPEAQAAVTLGWQALEAYRKAQAAFWFPKDFKLPGETED